MDCVAILVFVRLSCLLMTSLGGSGATIFTALETVGVREVSSQEKTVQARSRIECAVYCRRYPHCASLAYSLTDSICYLHPVTSGNTHNNITGQAVVVFAEEDNGACRPSDVEDTGHCDGGLVSLRPRKANGRHTIHMDNQFFSDWTLSVPLSSFYFISGYNDVNLTKVEACCVIEIYNGSNSSIPVHTSWRLADGYLVVNDMINGSWKQHVIVSTPPLSLIAGKPFFFRMTTNTSSTIDIMEYVAILVFVRLSCLLMPSLDGSGATIFTALETVGVRVVSSQEKTVQARSRIECAVHCRRYPHCASLAYSLTDSICYLHPVTSGDTQTSDNTGKTAVVFTVENPSCSNIPLNDSIKAVTIQRSLWSVQSNVTCHDDYFPSTLQVTCAADGKWSDVRCLKRVWRYPETMERVDRQMFKIPGTVTVGWSVCVQGRPTANLLFALEIRDKTDNVILVHTSWRLNFAEPTPHLALNTFDGVWGSEKRVRSPPILLKVGQPFDFKLTVNTSRIVHIYMDNQFFSDWTLSAPLSSFYYISGYEYVNLTKVEAWCRG